MILKPRHYRKLLNIMCLARAPLASFSQLKKAYRPVILSKWFNEIRTFQYEDRDQTILAEYLQKDQVKEKLVNSLKSLKDPHSLFKQNEFKIDYDDLIKEYFTEGSKIDTELVFTQDRFSDETQGKQNEKMKYFPTSFTTKIIFQQAYKCMFKQGKPFRNIFIGTPGISKSISFSFLTKISNEINQYIFQKTQDDYCKRLLEANLITRIPKFIYWNVPIAANFSDPKVINILKSQFPQLNNNKNISQDKKKIKRIIDEEEDLQIFIKLIREFYQAKGVLIVPIIDQINTFLKMKRQWVKFLIEERQHETNKTQLKDQSEKGLLLQDMRLIHNTIQKNKKLNSSSHCFFICSSTGQIRLMGQNIEPYSGLKKKHFSSQFVVASQQGHSILHKTQMNFLRNFYKDKEVRSELFNYLIFQFDQFNNLKKNDQHKEKNQISSRKQFLDKNKQFKKKLQQKFMSYQWIPSQTTFLQIREILSKKAKDNQEKKDFVIQKLSNQKSKEENFKIIEEEFVQIFNYMEEDGQRSLIKKIINFIQKDHDTVNEQRVQRMRALNQIAKKYEIYVSQQLKSESQEQQQQKIKKWIQDNFQLVQPYSLEQVLQKEYYSKDFFTFQFKSKYQTVLKPVITPKMLLQTIWPQIVIQRAVILSKLQWIQNLYVQDTLQSWLTFEKLLYRSCGNQGTQTRFFLNDNIKFSFKMNSSWKTFLNLSNDQKNNYKIGQKFMPIFIEAQKKIGTSELYIPKNDGQTLKHTSNNPYFDMLFVKYLQSDKQSNYKTKIVFYTIDATVGKVGGEKKKTNISQYITKVNDYYTDKTKNKKFIVVYGFAVQFIHIFIGHTFQTKEIPIDRKKGKECLFYRQAYNLNIKDIQFIFPNQYAQLLIKTGLKVKLNSQ